MFESFGKIKKEVLNFCDLIKECKSIDKDIMSNSSLDSEIMQLENGEFKIALIAPFSAGKSTFINSLIGQDLLSMEITAETSVITKIRFSKDIKLEIIYRNKDIIEQIPAENECAITTDQLQEILEKKTTVKGENTEDNIKEVRVYYPIEMCKDNVELVDTPGLFARHEKHEDITLNILPSVNAVIFMIDPESVGEEHFTEVIQNYVSNANNSNMELGGKHIFFVINKIDNFSQEDIEKAKNELKIVLKDIIDEPQIYEISAYCAMIGKMYLSKSIDLLKIQKDRKIKITDPEDPEYPLSGRQINEDNAHLILTESKIESLQKGLEKYLETKNKYLVDNLYREMESIIKQSIEKRVVEIKELQEMGNIDKEKYEKEMDSLKEEIDMLEKDQKNKINRKIMEITGGSKGDSITDILREKVEEEFIRLRRKIEIKIEKEWCKASIGLDRENAMDKVYSVLNSVNSEFEIKSKEISKEIFVEFKERLKQLVVDINCDIEEIKYKLTEIELKNIGKTLGNLGEYSVDSVLSTIEKSIEDEFSTIIADLSKNIRDRINQIEDGRTTIKEKDGIWYKIGRFFTGNKKYLTEFDNIGFRKDINGMIDEIQLDMADYIKRSNMSVGEKLEESITKISKELNNKVYNVLNRIVNIKKSMINNLIQSMKKSEKESKEIIIISEKQIKELELVYKDLYVLKNEIEEVFLNEL